MYDVGSLHHVVQSKSTRRVPSSSRDMGLLDYYVPATEQVRVMFLFIYSPEIITPTLAPEALKCRHFRNQTFNCEP